ncbi:MAG: methylenetetrahydrofolate reductase [Xanthomonadales bacterium]|nr:methylenetetrahydrofolate reductase [Xanthomonadales bacterium]
MASAQKTFRDAVRTEGFTITGQLRLHQDVSAREILGQARILAPRVNAVAITDNPFGVLHLSGLAAAAILLRDGIDPLLHLSARDRNRIALKSELLGAAALGVTSLLLQRGDRLPRDSEVTQVFDTGAKKFLATARQLSQFQVSRGEPELFLGTMATVFDPEADWQPTELQAKITAGAEFIQTQACLDLDLLRRYLKRLVAAQVTWHCHLVVSIPVLTSVESARWLFEHSRGAVIPQSVVRRFEQAADAEAFGVAYCAELIQAVKEIPGVRGVNLSTMGDVQAMVEVIRRATQ